MSPPRTDLAPPKEDPFTLEDLKQYDGKTEGKPIYVAIKGTVFDVSNKREMYGPGASYNIFAGKDGSRGLGMSSLDPANAVPDWSPLEGPQKATLDQWHSFFKARYNIVGKVTDLPDAVRGRE
ncbi:cytochrome b5 [Clavulina sp. PMI_390]|nr:cytochrome b5 [Clavulina sp. PMI_390]